MGDRFRAMAGELNERQRRWLVASEARLAGRGGIAAAARATGMSVVTIRKGIAEIESGRGGGGGGVDEPPCAARECRALRTRAAGGWRAQVA